jgi:hypothetical protein
MEDGLMLLMGVGAGLAAMYLLDPNEGRQRRSRLVQSAGDALESAGSAMGGALTNAGNKAANLSSDIAERAHAMGSNWMDSAREMIPQREPEHHYLGQTACALGSMALGAGLTYLLDPDEGADRRERISRSISETVGSAGEMFGCALRSARAWIRGESEGAPAQEREVAESSFAQPCSDSTATA